MSRLREWLDVEGNRVHVDCVELQTILDSLKSNQVALKGSNVFFMTYSLAANVKKTLF